MVDTVFSGDFQNNISRSKTRDHTHKYCVKTMKKDSGLDNYVELIMQASMP